MANQYRSVLASSGPAPTGGDALPAEVLSGKTFTNDNGAQTGTMTNNGAVTQTVAAGQSYTIPEGYHNGSGVITAGVNGAAGSCTANTKVVLPFRPSYVAVFTGSGSGNSLVVKSYLNGSYANVSHTTGSGGDHNATANITIEDDGFTCNSSGTYIAVQ